MMRTRNRLVRYSLPAALIAMLLVGSVSAAGPSEFVVHSFNGYQGSGPMGNLVADSAGNLYGTTMEGGSSGGWGTVYEMVRPVPPKAAWVESVLYSFSGASDGSLPMGGVIFDKAGNLFGTTSKGGTFDNGVVFELSPPTSAGAQWTEFVLHSFQPATGDGGSPQTALVWDSSGNLVGITYSGGANGNGCKGNCGTVFQLSPPSGPSDTWKETILFNFTYGLGAYPRGTPVFDAGGNLYGTTAVGGIDGCGVIYRLMPPATPAGDWTYRVLHAFTCFVDGAEPQGALTLHGKGILYGTTTGGGQYKSGTVFQLMPPAVPGGSWTENVLHSFTYGSGPNDGAYPAANVIFDGAGSLYGTTPYGSGATACLYNCGVVFELTPPTTEGGAWAETILHSFPATKTDGAAPSGGLIRAKNGVLFGVTQAGGAGNSGTVFGVIK